MSVEGFKRCWHSNIGSPNWEECQIYDFNKNGKVDIQDFWALGKAQGDVSKAQEIMTAKMEEKGITGVNWVPILLLVGILIVLWWVFK